MKREEWSKEEREWGKEGERRKEERRNPPHETPHQFSTTHSCFPFVCWCCWLCCWLVAVDNKTKAIIERGEDKKHFMPPKEFADTQSDYRLSDNVCARASVSLCADKRREEERRRSRRGTRAGECLIALPKTHTHTHACMYAHTCFSSRPFDATHDQPRPSLPQPLFGHGCSLPSQSFRSCRRRWRSLGPTSLGRPS